MTHATRLPNPVKVGELISFNISQLVDGVPVDMDVSLVTSHFRHGTEGKLGFGTVTKISSGVFQVAYPTTGLTQGDVFFDVKFNTNPVYISPTMMCTLDRAETT